MIDPEFDLFHKYRRLVRRGRAKPLECGVCGGEFLTKMGKDDRLVLECTVCDRVILPGLALRDKVRAVVMEHFDD